MTTGPDYETQLSAMRAVMEALKPLDQSGREAVLVWVNTQLGIQALPANTKSRDPIPKHETQKRDGTVSVVAQKLAVKSARDLLLAAAGHLTLYQGKDSFSKEELVLCAKEARSWKAVYTNQMASNIKRMSDAGVLFERAKDVFSLSDETLTDLEERLVQ